MYGNVYGEFFFVRGKKCPVHPVPCTGGYIGSWPMTLCGKIAEESEVVAADGAQK